MPRPRARRYASRPRRATEWFENSFSEVLISDGAAASELNNLTSGMDDDVKKGSTIVRIVGSIYYSANSAGVLARFSLGIIMLNDDQIAAASFPDPLTGGETDRADWMWKHGGMTHRDLDAGPQVEHFDIDIKGQRRFPSGAYDLELIAEVDDSAIIFGGFLRVLLMKH